MAWGGEKMDRRMTDFRRGDRVRFLVDCDSMSGHTAKVGETGTLGQLYRVQQAGGPYEVWEVLLDRTYQPLGISGGHGVKIRVCASHLQIERITEA